VQRRIRYDLGCAARESTAKDRQPSQRLPFTLLEQLPGPIEEGPQAALALGRVPPVNRQEIEALLNLTGNLRQGQRLGPASGKLEAERHALHQLADTSEVVQPGSGQVESRLDSLGGLDE
jgi:hypothetical protein